MGSLKIERLLDLGVRGDVEMEEDQRREEESEQDI